MCLSTEALILFLSLLPQEIVTPSGDTVIIAAETATVSWDHFDGQWCTTAPYLAAAPKR